MSKIKDPVILFQYRTAPKLSKLLEGLKEFFISNSKEDIFNFFNLDKATGLWLDQLGNFLNVQRPLIEGNTFIMDLSLMDGSDLLDGTSYANDNIYRAYIKGQIYKRNSRFTIDDIISVLQFTFGVDNCVYLVEEGIKKLKIYAGLATTEDKINLDLLNNFNPKWFGTPSGVGIDSFITYVIPSGTTFFITDYHQMDNPNYLMI